MNTLDGVAGTRLAATDSHSGRTRIASGDHITDARSVIAEHTPNHDRTSCTACQFTYTPKNPLCPSAADALRVLAGADLRPRSSGLRLGRQSTRSLVATARAHTGEGRCGRCGFVYSGQVRICPTLRRVSAELESRGKAVATKPRAGQVLCEGKGAGWNVDGRDAGPWKRAMAACSRCPLLAQCEARLESGLADGEDFAEQIIAGRLFASDGREIPADGIQKFASARRNDTRSNRRKKANMPPRTAISARSALPLVAQQPALHEDVAA
jgi:hypothetical protein